MNRSFFTICLAFSIIIGTSTFLQNCAVDVKSECELPQFEGKYVGKYQVAFFVIPVPDTILISVDVSNNQATVTSISLDTFFVAKYSNENKQLIIPPIVIDEYTFNDTYLRNISIAGGRISLAGGCDLLSIEMDNLNIEEHNIGDLPEPIVNLELITPNKMERF
ncbi:MAG: hypothetical protein R2728_03750 [Chitinophagales bacterium]